MNRPVAIVYSIAALMSAYQANAEEIMSPVAAELATGESVNERADRRAMARCIADYYPEAVHLVMLRQDTSSDLKDGKHVLINPSCVRSKLFRAGVVTINSEYYSYMAEYLLTSDYDIESLPDISHVAPLYHPDVSGVDPTNLPAHYRQELALERWRYALDVAAECVARAAPKRVFALAATKTDSGLETSRIAGLSSQLESCKALTLSPTPPIFAIRSSLSEALYRLVNAAHPVVHHRSATVTTGLRRP